MLPLEIMVIFIRHLVPKKVWHTSPALMIITLELGVPHFYKHAHPPPRGPMGLEEGMGLSPSVVFGVSDSSR